MILSTLYEKKELWNIAPCLLLLHICSTILSNFTYFDSYLIQENQYYNTYTMMTTYNLIQGNEL